MLKNKPPHLKGIWAAARRTMLFLETSFKEFTARTPQLNSSGKYQAQPAHNSWSSLQLKLGCPPGGLCLYSTIRRQGLNLSFQKLNSRELLKV